ncbi:MAG: hypothetical protein A2381_07825 [Bdellovibrionales bacterium RIFOXYB1_FULL_37_110]|nr:MAG: hypothetical protein A2181_04590 [Bdellovibrionales bacterium RIFOXYA1_FULL_38_20]OFZ52512.1 MAG: hypothetical protein A2417_00545 [Bdellovibrionales bacterium RIFOXYC1_FULL_37_79]OFZ59714.1 MAG: hypothetical protein A2381_07825 [Bdellovibrionales bacterium RIFOXYB1_FULL_37_110]OFZ62641.1 MAG: hypothetical protein A2577_12145 [Bdellovibrionales bacterium RIFOXYD1_FULL_36_51]
MFHNHSPLIIAGPCSAENRQQVFQIAQALKETGKVDIFRAGIWKPRTMPGTYEGPGESGLLWLEDVQKELDILVATEVATPAHVEKALKHNISILWIGARTSVNPFSVKELAHALSGTDTTVLIKNPINADISLWIGAIERIKQAGIKKIMLVHRGFTSLNPAPYRYDPIWKIPIEIIKRYPDLPLLCDPSHISGNRQYIEQISQKALDLNMKGLMLEVHNDPMRALVDQQQQITPAQFVEIIERLKKRKENSTNQSYLEKLEELRGQIDKIDHEMLHQLASRKEVVTEIAKLKFQNNIGPLQLGRFQKICQERIKWGQSLGLSKEMIEELFTTIHEDAVKYQSDLMKTF